MVVGHGRDARRGRHAIGTLSWTVVLLPADLAPQRHVSDRPGGFLSLLNVIFRDIQNLLTPVLMIMLIISPIAYTPEIVPDSLKPLIVLNPFAYFVVAYQQVHHARHLPGPPPRARTRAPGRQCRSSRGAGSSAAAKRVIVDYV